MNGIRQRLRQTMQGEVSPTSVLVAGIVLILLQLCFRGWAALGSWFYGDDYNLLSFENGRPLSVARLMEPYNDHVMPGGRFLARVVSHAGTLNWELAAGLAVLGQLLASAAALWMLVTLFGPRLGILMPLTLYLFSAITLPAYIWWSAALIQLIPQAALMTAVGSWVRYLRSRSWRWLLATNAAVATGLLFSEKSALTFLVLIYLAVAYFAEGGPIDRVRSLIVTYWPAVLLAGLVGGAHTAFYVTNVDSALQSPSWSLAGKVAYNMLGSAFPTGVLGGPWRWTGEGVSAAYADPPLFAVYLSWVVLVASIAYLALHRTGTMRAWAFLTGYLVVLYGLLLTGRAPDFGARLALDYRFLTDGLVVMVLCLGLASMTLLDARQSSAARDEPLLRVSAPRTLIVALTVVIGLSGLVNSVVYTRVWQTTNASDAYLQALSKDLRTDGTTDLADVPVPKDVISPLNAPDNTVRLLADLASDTVRFPEASSRLVVPDDAGNLHPVEIELGVESRPGRTPGCGWRVAQTGRSIPLSARAFPWTWWLRVGYLASDNSQVRVSAGDSTVDTEVLAGLNTLFVRVEGSFTQIRIEGLDSGVSMCVDDIQVGQAVPEGSSE